MGYSYGAGGGGTSFVTVANYSALPAAATQVDKYYNVTSPQGSRWIFTYKPKGIYYSDGLTWDYRGEFPSNAAQATVDTGTNDEEFVTSKTFNDSAQLASKASLTGAETLTNKRITKRVTSIVSNATPTVNTDNTDKVVITALAVAITSMTTNLSGTPVEGDLLWYQIKDNGTARAITWGASFEAKGQALPTTTTLNKRINVLFSWDAVTSKWGCLDAVVEA